MLENYGYVVYAKPLLVLGAFINYVDNQGEGGKTKAYVVNLSIIERKGTKNPVIVDYEWSQVVDSMHNFSLLDASFQIV